MGAGGVEVWMHPHVSGALVVCASGRSWLVQMSNPQAWLHRREWTSSVDALTRLEPTEAARVLAAIGYPTDP